MPMIHRRRRVDKKKRRRLFEAEQIKLNELNKNTINLEQPIRKNKNGQIVDLKLEKKTLEECSSSKELKPKSKLNKTIEIKEVKHFIKEECNEDVKKEISSPLVKSKQRYELKKFHFHFINN